MIFARAGENYNEIEIIFNERFPEHPVVENIQKKPVLKFTTTDSVE